MKYLRHFSLLLLALLTLSVQGAGAPATLTVFAGNNQSATVNTTLPIAPAVQVADASGNGVGAGVVVNFAITNAGGGSISGAAATTDANSIATLGSWTLGIFTGTYTLSANCGSAPAIAFSASGTPDIPASLVIVAGDNQSAYVGAAVAGVLCARVKDQYRNFAPVGTVVSFVVASGGGTITGANATTDGIGIATLGGWKLGPVAGTNTLTASCGSTPPVTFTATAKDVPVTVQPTPAVLSFLSPAAAAPNPAMAGAAVTLSASAISTAPVSYIWSFGDGSGGSGAAVTHVFSPAGTYAVTLVASSTTTVSNSGNSRDITVTTTNTQTAIGTAAFNVVVIPATGEATLLAEEFDSDGDGFGDAVEAAAGSNPFDAQSTPGGTALGMAPASKLKMKLSAQKKTLALSGELHLPVGFSVQNQNAVIDVAGFIQRFQLTAKGAGKTGSDTFKLNLKSKRGVMPEQDARFSVLLHGAPASVNASSPLLIVIGSTVFTAR